MLIILEAGSGGQKLPKQKKKWAKLKRKLTNFTWFKFFCPLFYIVILYKPTNIHTHMYWMGILSFDFIGQESWLNQSGIDPALTIFLV